jgi:DNA-binding NarL/FixJ family response regulator
VTEGAIRVLIVDDQSLVRQGLSVLLTSEGDIQIVGEAANGIEACRMAEQLNPAVILMDIRMPGIDGVSATAQILKKQPHIKIIVLTTFDDDEYLIGALRAGACGYLLKDTPFEELAEAIRVVLTGKSLLSGEMMGKLINTAPPPAASVAQRFAAKLSERELEVLSLIGKGKTNQEIASDLCLTEGTVKNHVTKILAAIGAKNRLQAALLLQDGETTS